MENVVVLDYYLDIKNLPFVKIRLEATAVLKDAQELSRKVSEAIENFNSADQQCKEAVQMNNKAEKDAELARTINTDIVENIKASYQAIS